MRIFQLSDIHIGKPDEFPHDIDVRSNFKRIVDNIEKYKPDIIVITGDLAYRQGNKKIYSWIREQLLFLDLPLYVINGNHDDPVLIQKMFHPDNELSPEGKLYFHSKKLGETIVFLDSGDGNLGIKQLKWFEEILDESGENRIIVFMHHPPIVCQVPHMDEKHGLRDMNDFQKIVSSKEKELIVFTGHFHIQRAIKQDNMSVFICPAGFYQLQADSEKFAIDHCNPGFQVIDLDAKKVMVHAHYAL